MKLKFRAWDKEFNRMLETLTMKELCMDASYLTEEEYSSLIITQSTGLHDKNGVEIFIGDIVKDWRYIESEIVFHDGTVSSKRGILVFPFNSEIAKSVKVISNIFKRGNYE